MPVLAPRVLTPMTVGQQAVGVLTFDGGVPPDGAVASDNPAVCPVSLASDGITWTAGPSLAEGIANMTYTGTSVAPLSGPSLVPAVVITIQAVPVAETGSFNEDTAVIT